MEAGSCREEWRTLERGNTWVYKYWQDQKYCFWKNKNNNTFIVQFNYFAHTHTYVYICVYVHYICRYIITMCVLKICSSYSGYMTNYPKTLWLKMITLHLLFTIWAGMGRHSFSLQKVASAWVAQRLGTRIIWGLALMSHSWCWLLAETFAGAVDWATLYHMATGFQRELPHTCAHTHGTNGRLFQVEETASTSVSWGGKYLMSARDRRAVRPNEGHTGVR